MTTKSENALSKRKKKSDLKYWFPFGTTESTRDSPRYKMWPFFLYIHLTAYWTLLILLSKCLWLSFLLTFYSFKVSSIPVALIALCIWMTFQPVLMIEVSFGPSDTYLPLNIPEKCCTPHTQNVIHTSSFPEIYIPCFTKRHHIQLFKPGTWESP